MSGKLEHSDEEFDRAAARAEATYYVMLCATVEGMLYIHLGDHYRFSGLPKDKKERERVGADALLNAIKYRVRPNTSRKISDSKFNAARNVYAYRNRIAHGDRSGQNPVELERAFNALEALVLELPDMITND